MTLALNTNLGTANTIVVEDNDRALYFWNDYFTHSSQQEHQEEWEIDSEVDLMGNPVLGHFVPVDWEVHT
jgi:hypothetical protein